MIYTTYFANLKNLNRYTSCPIAICGKSPASYHGLEYKKLAPKYWFFKEWKKTHDNDFYIKYFNEEVLNQTSLAAVMEDLRQLLNNIYNLDIGKVNKWWEHVPFDIYLVCYEKPGDFCHRHLVADWMIKGGINVQEKES